MTEADDQILQCLKARRSFLLDAGAGSGKTSSLIKALNYIRGAERPKLIQNAQRVACITYTNVAKDEIIERTERDPLFEVSTIHDFLWQVIKPFQRELKSALLAFNDELPPRSRRKHHGDELEIALRRVPVITYSDRGANFLEGRIFHDDLLGVAFRMFKDNPALSKIVAAKFPFIFVDEYQDTNPKVISILMDCIAKAAHPSMIAFFGDKMQSIYPDVVGEMPKSHQDMLYSIKKEENYRCSKAVINLLNNIRSDIRQRPAGDNAEGAAVYLNLAGTQADDDVAGIATQILSERLGWTPGGEQKVLFLTHRVIARKAGYEALWNAYNDRGGFARERFQAGEDPIIAFFLTVVEPLIEAWREGREGRAISVLAAANRGIAGGADRRIAGREERRRLRQALDDLVKLASAPATTGDVLRHISDLKLVPLLDDFELALRGEVTAAEEGSAEAAHHTFLTRLLQISYREISNYRMVFDEHLPFSTKHGVKGAEFENVFVVLDDAGANWNQYSFGNLLSGADTSESRFSRTRNLFYVCCSRARVNLAVIDLGSASGKEASIAALFGRENVLLNGGTGIIG